MGGTLQIIMAVAGFENMEWELGLGPHHKNRLEKTERIEDK